MKKTRFPLLAKILVAILLGVVLGHLLPEGWVRVFLTINGIFSQFLGFMIPFIIIGFVAPAMADVGNKAGRLLLITVGLAFADTIFAGLLAYATGSCLFPSMIGGVGEVVVEQTQSLEPYFSMNIPPLADVMTALVFSFVMGLGIAYGQGRVLKGVFDEFRDIVSGVIARVIVPLLPLYIFGIFLSMAHSGEAYRILAVFAQIIVVIVVLHVVILIYEFIIAGGLTRRNPFRLLLTMLPAYFTALGTSSSAATIPVTLRQTIQNGVGREVAGFTVPLCATIHMPGSMMKITSCAFAICLIHGLPHDWMLFLNFILLLSVCMVASPGVPGGSVMAALGPLATVLGFTPEMQALMIALYIAMDSFGTACNVTGDGAIALIVDKVNAAEVKPEKA